MVGDLEGTTPSKFSMPETEKPQEYKKGLMYLVSTAQMLDATSKANFEQSDRGVALLPRWLPEH
jgi:hypothetical protein